MSAIRGVLHLAREVAWTLVFKLAERRFPPDEPQSFDEAARVRARWVDKHTKGKP